MKTVKMVLASKGSDVASITPEATALEAARRLRDEGIGSLLVMQGDRLLGLVSERDITYRLVASGGTPGAVPVSEIMSAEVVCVTPERTVEECMALMTERRVRHLPVTEGGKVVGVISIGDAVKAVIADQQFTIEQLASYIAS